MSSELRQVFEGGVEADNPNLKILQERGLVRRDITADELEDEMIRESIVEQAVMRFHIRDKSERLEILSELGANNRYDQSMAADALMQPVSDEKTVLAVLDDKAREIWSKTMEPIRQNSADLNADVIEAERMLADRNFDGVQEFLGNAVERTRELAEQFQNTFIEAKRELRSQYTAEFGRMWEPQVSDRYNATVDRTVFLPPEEYREVMDSVTDLRQSLVKQHEYSTELKSRIERSDPSMTPTAQPKP